MAVLAHNHDWAATAGGYRCLNCTAALSDADIASNQPSANEKAGKDGLNARDFFSRVWHNGKGGG